MIVTEWQARYGFSTSGYQNQYNLLVSQGYRLVKVSGYCENNEARYAGIWHKRGGNAWQARHGISADAYQQAIIELDKQEYRPIHVSVFTIGDQQFFSAIWEQQRGLPWIARHGLTSAEYQQLFNDLSRQGWRLRCVSGYEVGGDARYACIWDQYAGPDWAARYGLDASAYQQAFDEFNSKGFRPIQVVGYPVQGTPYFAAIWEQSPGYAWKARHGIAAVNYQQEFNDIAAYGFRLVDVSGYAVGSTAEFTTIWEDAAADNPNADAVSAFVIPFMQKWAVPGLSLAVARSGNMIANRSFGYANPITREIVTSSTRFRIASVSKPITASTIFKLIEQNQLALTDTIFGSGGRLGTQYGTLPYGPNIESITLQHLLEHTSGGWPKGDNDPMFHQTNLSVGDLISWTLDNQPLLDTPGSTPRYSNFGYCLLGRVIETVTGQSYADAVRNLILAPSGVTQITIAGNTAAERQYPEAMYYGVDLQAPYELPIQRMDSHGGWIATPSDLLQFLMRVDGFASPADVLQAETVTTMTTPSVVDPTYAKGWSITPTGTRWHNGALAGTRSILVRTSNQHEWVAVCNTGDPRNNQFGSDLDALMWQVDGAVLWPKGKIINSIDHTPENPAGCVFNEQLYVFWKADDDSNSIYFSPSSDGMSWRDGQTINDIDHTSENPAVCVFNNQLYVFWKADDDSNSIYFSASSDGITWPEGQKINGTDHSPENPVACVFNQQLYVFWKADDDSNSIYFSASLDGAHWPDGQTINGTDHSPENPAVCVFNNQLYVFWKADDDSNSIYFSASSDGVHWPDGQTINEIDHTPEDPAVCVFQNKLYVFWKADDASNSIYFSAS